MPDYHISKWASCVVVVAAALLLAFVFYAVEWHAISVISFARFRGDYLYLAEGLVIYCVFSWVLFCVMISLIIEIGAEIAHLLTTRDSPIEYRSFYRREAQSDLLILVPSYREEVETIWQALVSGALAEHPKRHVVLLIDDPDPAMTPENARLLASARSVPRQLQ